MLSSLCGPSLNYSDDDDDDNALSVIWDGMTFQTKPNLDTALLTKKGI